MSVSPSPSGRFWETAQSFCRSGCFFLCFLAIAVGVHFSDMETLLSPAGAGQYLRPTEDSFGAQVRGLLLYTGAVAVLTPFGMPRQALSLLGGYLWGVVWGTAAVSLGLTLGCCTGFFLSRFAARAFMQRRFGRQTRCLDAFLSRHPFGMTVAIRLFPFGNNALTTWLAGLTSISGRAFVAGSALGYLPQSLIFTLLGSGMRIDSVWLTALSCLFFLAASALGYLLYRRHKGECLLNAAGMENKGTSDMVQETAPVPDKIMRQNRSEPSA